MLDRAEKRTVLAPDNLASVAWTMERRAEVSQRRKHAKLSHYHVRDPVEKLVNNKIKALEMIADFLKSH